MDNKTITELKAIAKEHGIKGYSIMNKAKLKDAIELKFYYGVRDYNMTNPYLCSHWNLKYTCKKCGGSPLCEHNISKYACKLCKGSSICMYNKQRYRCKDCGGKGICIHGKQKHKCQECSSGCGVGMCIHGKTRLNFQECQVKFID